MDAYTTRPAGGFFDLTRSIVESEIKSGNTVSLINEIDATQIEALRRRMRTDRPSYTAFVVKALAVAKREFPYANRRIYRSPFNLFGGSRLQEFCDCDVAVACERDEDGIEVATFIDVLRNADRLPLVEINAWLRRLAGSSEADNAQWRDFKRIGTRWPRWLAKWAVRLPVLFPSLWHRYRGGASLVSSPAKYGVDIMNGSWTATLGVSFGFVKPRAVAVNGRVEARPTFWFLLNFDRRVMAGAQAARFFKRIVTLLEDPAEGLLAGKDLAAAQPRSAGPLEPQPPPLAASA